MFRWRKPRRPKLVAFDVIGTLFPLDPLRPRIVELGLPPLGLETWFATALRDAFAISTVGGFKPFTTVLEQALDQVLAGQELEPEQRLRTGLVTAIETLPPARDARAAFEALAKADIQIVALSNGAMRVTRKLLGSSGLEPLVNRIVSVEEVKLFKPRQEVYAHTVKVCRVKPARAVLVAAHAWDILGGKSAGMATAYVSRNRPFPSVMGRPDIEEPEIGQVVDALLAI